MSNVHYLECAQCFAGGSRAGPSERTQLRLPLWSALHRAPDAHPSSRVREHARLYRSCSTVVVVFARRAQLGLRGAEQAQVVPPHPSHEPRRPRAVAAATKRTPTAAKLEVLAYK